MWGVHQAKARRVLHVDLEQGGRLTTRRYQRLAGALGVDLAGLGDTLSVAVMPPLTLRADALNQWGELMTGRDLVIIDSFRVAAAGLDENSSEVREPLDMLGRVSEATGCRAVVIAHSRKPSEGAQDGRYAIRGSGAIFDGVDGAWVFGAAKDEPIKVQHEKYRTFGEQVPDFALVISDVAVGSDLKGGIRVQVHGAELVDEARERSLEATRLRQQERDAAVVVRVLTRATGLGYNELRARAHLSGDRLAGAIAHLGPRVQIRDEKSENSRSTRRHYLTSVGTGAGHYGQKTDVDGHNP